MEEEVEKNPEEELFVKLADAIGESPEEVWRMSDVERRQLIEVLGWIHFDFCPEAAHRTCFKIIREGRGFP